jgi:hypothetical protein
MDGCMSSDNPLESSIEKEAMAYAESRGWFQIKIMRASIRGFPDRFLVRDGVVILIEFKRHGKGPTVQQTKRHTELRAHGCTVYVIDNPDEAKRILR